ncbi:MAG: hypothetical protein H7A04_16085 [Pseudomonadales bacterium]|nr:hypothetical protein [Pseudomonadales bacterium]
MFKKTLAIVLFFVGSSSASALTSICSGEVLPLTGLTTLKHEASWSYYDNWFYNMFVEISSEVEGSVSTAAADEVQMKEGGSVLHFLDSPPDGSYAIRGSVQIGYPLPWGFDGYYGIECPPWIGDLANADITETNLSEPPSLKVVTSGVQLVSGASIECPVGEGSGCLLESQSSGTTTVVSGISPDPIIVNAREYPPEITIGIVDSMDDEHLTVRTSVGRYVKYTLPTALSVYRQTRVDQVAIGDADVVGLVWSSPLDTDTGALIVRIYRNPRQQEISASQVTLLANNPGIELRSAVSEVVRSGERNPRLVYSQETTTLLVPSDASLMVVEPVSLEGITPQLNTIRVVAQPSDGEIPIARIIEILQ